jgi:hypothetical protein
MVRKGLATPLVFALFAAACVDGTTTTAPRVEPTASIVQGSCRVSDDAGAKIRTLSGNCSNSIVKLPAGWSVRFDTGRDGSALQGDGNVTSTGIAAFNNIGRPVAQYTSQTTKISIAGLQDFQVVSSISDGNTTVRFDIPMEKRTVGLSWGTWGVPPFTEDAFPPILWTNFVDQLTMRISRDVQAFGFELEPNAFNIISFTASFYSSTRQLLGTITRDVDGSGGARLFAAYVTGTTPLIRGVRVGSTGGPLGFAIAQVRYAP